MISFNQYLSVDDGRETEIVENFCAVPPDGDAAVLAQALVVEAVHLSDLTGLVVAANQGYPVGITNLKQIKLNDD